MRFVVGAGLTAAIAVGVATFLADAFSLSGAWWLSSMRVFGFQWQLEWGPRQIISLCAIGVLAALNCRSVRTSGNTQSVFAGFKVAVLFVLIVSAALATHGPGVVQPTTTSSTSVAHGGFALAVLGGLQAYNGWVFVAMMSGEVADFRRNYARDIIVGTLIVIALYVLINIGYVKLFSVSEISLSNSAAHPDAQSVGTKLARVLFGSSAGAVMAVAFAVSALGALHCSLLSIPRIFYAMARDGLFPRAFACVDRRTSVPRTAIVCFAIWVAVLTLIGGYDRLGNMAIFAAYLFYCCNVVGLMVLRRRWPNAKRPFAVPAYPWIPLAFLLGSLAMPRVLSGNMARRGLGAILALNAVAAAAAAIVLAVAPGLIPSIAGIAIDRAQNLVPYLLAAAELAIAALAALAIRSRSIEVKRLSVSVLIIFHAGSAVAGIAAVTQGAGVVVTLNVVVRVIMIAALAVCAPAPRCR